MVHSVYLEHWTQAGCASCTPCDRTHRRQVTRVTVWLSFCSSLAVCECCCSPQRLNALESLRPCEYSHTASDCLTAVVVCTVRAACCMLHAVCRMLYVARSVSHAVCCTQCVACCMLHAVCRMLYVARSVSHAVCCGSARLQTVSASDDPWLQSLLRCKPQSKANSCAVTVLRVASVPVSSAQLRSAPPVDFSCAAVPCV